MLSLLNKMTHHFVLSLELILQNCLDDRYAETGLYLPGGADGVRAGHLLQLHRKDQTGAEAGLHRRAGL